MTSVSQAEFGGDAAFTCFEGEGATAGEGVCAQFPQVQGQEWRVVYVLPSSFPVIEAEYPVQYQGVQGATGTLNSDDCPSVSHVLLSPTFSCLPHSCPSSNTFLGQFAQDYLL
jgi:hypothetical protein